MKVLEKSRKITVLLLVMVMVLSNIVPAMAQTVSSLEKAKGEELKTTIIMEDGRPYNYIPLTKEQVKSMEKPIYSVRSVGDELPIGSKYRQIGFDWGAYDSYFPANTRVKLWVVDVKNRKKIAIAETDILNKSDFVDENGKGLNKKKFYMFKQTDKYDEWDAKAQADSRNYKYAIGYPEMLLYSVTARFTKGVQMSVQQVAMSLYSVDWNTVNNEKLNLKANFYETADVAYPLNLIDCENGKKYYTTMQDHDRQSYVINEDGTFKKVDIYGGSKNWIRTSSGMSDALGAKRNRFELIDPNTSKEFPTPGYQGSESNDYGLKNGEFKTNDKTYKFNITGDHRTPFNIAITQQLNVKFDPNGGKFTDDKSTTEKTVKAWHSEALTAPAVEKENMTFAGWTTTKDDEKTKVDFNTFKPTEDNVTYYALYTTDMVNITAAADPANKATVKTEGNPIEVAKGSTWATIKDQVAGLVTANDDHLITKWEIKLRQGETKTVDDNTTFDQDTEVTAVLKPIVTTDDKSQDSDYALVQFLQGDHGKLAINKQEVASPYKYYVLKEATWTEAKKHMTEPSIVPDKEYTVKTPKWDNGFEKLATEKVTAKDFTAQYDRIPQEADKYEGKLTAKGIPVWKGDTIDWKKGIEVASDVNDGKLPDKAEVVDQDKRDSSTKGKFPGKLVVEFSDGSKIGVEPGKELNQNLIVFDEIIKDEDKTDLFPDKDITTVVPGKDIPADAIKVTFKKGDGIEKIGETVGGGNIVWQVKPATVLKDETQNIDLFPKAEVSKGYENKVVWLDSGEGTNYVVSTTNNTFTAKAKKLSDETIIPYLPGEDEPTTDKTGKTIDKNEYVKIVLSVNPSEAGTLTLGDKTGQFVNALVKKNTSWKTVEKAVTMNPANNYAFWYWSDAKGENVSEGETRTAYFIKDGQELKDKVPNGQDDAGKDKEKDRPALPVDWFVVKVDRDEKSITEDNLYVKIYAVKKNSTLPSGTNPTITAQKPSEYTEPYWMQNNKKIEAKDISTIAIIVNTNFLAKADKKTLATKYGDKLEAKDIVVWKDTDVDTINWKDGVKQKGNLILVDLEKALEEATVKEATNPARETGKAGTFEGKVKVTFSDNSYVEVDKQNLVVAEHVTKDGSKTPADAINVTFKAKDDGGVTGLDKAGQREVVYKVKPATTLREADLPVITLDNDHKKPLIWDTDPVGVTINEEKTFTVSATVGVFNKDAVVEIKFVKDPNKMSYIVGEGIELKGLQIWMKDDKDNTKTIGPNELENYGITLSVENFGEIKEGTVTTINDHNNKKITATMARGKDGELSADSIGFLKVSEKPVVIEKTTPPFINPVKPEDKIITGTGVVGAEVIVTLPNGDTTRVTVDNNGNWGVKVDPQNPLRPGETISAVQKENGKDVSDPFRRIVDKYYDGDNTIKIGIDLWRLQPPKKAEKTEKVYDLHKAYIKGYPDGSVRPNGNITRAEVAAMLSRILELDMSDSTAPNFTDTKDNAWYNAAINAIVKRGLMRGYPDGSFKPNAPITRAEFAQTIKTIDKANAGNAPFEDVKGHWAKEAIDQAYANGRIVGYPDGTFRPDQYITRGEVAKIINSLFDRKVTARGLATIEKGEIARFTDLNESYWGYYEMVEATNTHTYERVSKGEVEELWHEVLSIN